MSNVDLNWEHPALSRFLRELARLGRLIITDRRGLGCSERFTPADTPPIEALMGDLEAVLDAAGSTRAVIFATGDCGFIASLFAATYPERATALVLYGSASTWLRNDELPWGWTEQRLQEETVWLRDHLGDGEWMRQAAPTLFSNTRELAWAGRYERLSVAPGAVVAEALRFAHTDIRGILPSVQTPTLVLHRVDDTYEDIRSGRDLAARIRGAKLLELEGSDHLAWAGDQQAVIQAITEFLAGVHREEADLERVLATVLFTDIVGSTEKAASLGDRKLGRAPAAAPPDRAWTSGPVQGQRDRHRRRWLLRDLRRAARERSAAPWPRWMPWRPSGSRYGQASTPARSRQSTGSRAGSP